MLAPMPPIDMSNPVNVIILVALAVALAVMAVGLWNALRHRSRRYGGGTVAALVMALAVVTLIAAVSNQLPLDIGMFLLIASLAAIYRPEQVVRLTGGASLRYRALQEGRELQLVVREHGGWAVARQNEEVKERVEGLAAFEGPGTERYVGLLRDTLLADPAAPGGAEKLAEVAAADAELRESLGARPMFERELEKRAAALDGDAAAP